MHVSAGVGRLCCLTNSGDTERATGAGSSGNKRFPEDADDASRLGQHHQINWGRLKPKVGLEGGLQVLAHDALAKAPEDPTTIQKSSVG